MTWGKVLLCLQSFSMFQILENDMFQLVIYLKLIVKFLQFHYLKNE